jgi:hypothetical protein
MSLETATYLDSLVDSNPSGADALSTADDHIRLLKACLQRTFPNVTGEVTATHTQLNNAALGAVTASYAQSADYALSADYAISANHAASASTAFTLTNLVEYYNAKPATYTLSAVVNTVTADNTWQDISLCASVWYEIDSTLRLQQGVLNFLFNFTFSQVPQDGEVLYQSTGSNSGMQTTGIHTIGGADTTVNDDTSSKIIQLRGSFLTNSSNGGNVDFAFGQARVGALSTNEDVELLMGSTMRIRKL